MHLVVTALYQFSRFTSLPLRKPTSSTSTASRGQPSQPPLLAEPRSKPSSNLSPTIPKVVFDIRNDSEALFSPFQISVNGIKDLQLMELATRKGSQTFVSSLAKCIEKASPMSIVAEAEWRLAKERSLRLFDPKKRGRYEVFDKRPLEIVQYCQQDVAVLPALYGVYNTTLRQTGQALWRVRIRGETENRIKLSQSPRYNGNLESAAAQGWDDQQVERWIDSWNDDILMEHMLGTSVLNENDEWVDAPRSGIDDYLDYLENLDEDGGEEQDGDWHHDDITARDCIGWAGTKYNINLVLLVDKSTRGKCLTLIEMFCTLPITDMLSSKNIQGPNPCNVGSSKQSVKKLAQHQLASHNGLD
ncbi:hypothetical protein VC83_07404 [Pseudogymnoascus destructans]|uniref:3'-5' exonuclease domain-containing protein n=1 Tax=Pseudogymnoascus destructans TaxID=655981 RepID=A0A177A192_9PEZI|nr:uncharacterized protein VC83_07404 [Pseudogymnoascus destructans]OAF56039.1 hypothetical protein VC83_07404 [Pseudogymnoascus destructans]